MRRRAYLAGLWQVEATVEPAVAEIPSPEGVRRWPTGSSGCGWRWRGRGLTLGARYVTFRDDVVRFLPVARSTPWCSATSSRINAAIGAALGDDRLVVRSLDNCSVTVIDVDRRCVTAC